MDFYNLGKRTIDIIGALVGLILFSPLMLATALYIKFVSPEGPVFADIPERVGRGGKTFKMHKFRSMIPNAQEWLLKNPELYEKYKANNYKLDSNIDPRLFKGGKFIRQTSIDELPQFINVLKGEMSIVGPRAYYPFELNEQRAKHNISTTMINDVLLVKPGITGVWQVNGRSEIPFTDRVKIDAEYAKKKSLVYDLLIILKTPYVVVTKKGVI